MADREADLLIIGAGIVGLATALEVTRRFPRLRIVVVEKEDRRCRPSDRTQQRRHPLRHLLQDGLAEGAQLRGGRGFDEAFLPGARHPLRRVRQAGGRDQCRRGSAAGTAAPARQSPTAFPGLRMMQREQFREIEPHCEGLRALQVPSTGIVDYTVVAQKYAELIQQAQAARSSSAPRSWDCASDGDSQHRRDAVRGTFRARYVINCAGLYSDAITRMAGVADRSRDHSLSRRVLRGAAGTAPPGARPDLSRCPIRASRFSACISRGA